MTYLRRYLDDNPTVLVASAGESDNISGADSAYDFQFVATGEAARSAVDDHVVCLFVVAPLPDCAAIDLATDVLATDDVVSVLVSPDEPGSRLASEVGAVGATYIPPSLRGKRLSSAIETAAGVGERRRSDALISDAFEQFLADNEETIYVKDAAGRYLAVSAPSTRPDPAEFLGKTDLEIASEREGGLPLLERRHEDSMSVVETGEPIRCDVEQFGTGEAAFWFERSVFPWRIDGSIAGVVGLERLVTSRYKTREEMETRIEQLEQFTSYVAHDLRSPLQVADSYLERAREGDPAAFERVREANDRMQELIDDLETLVGTESTAIDESRTVRLAEIASDLWSVIETPETALKIDVADDTIVNAPESAIRPILENLFRTAVPDEQSGEEPAERTSGTVRLAAFGDGFAVIHDTPGSVRSEDDEDVGFEIVEKAAETQGWTFRASDRQDGGRRYEIGNCTMVSESDRTLRPVRERALDTTTTVGDVQRDGSADEADGVWTVAGAGGDIYEDRNEFQFVYTEVEGPVRIRARLLEMDDPNPYSKAGIMVRDSLTEDAAFGYVGHTPEQGTEVLWCPESGEQTVSQQLDGVTGQRGWLELVYDGERATASISTDGESWRPVDQRPVSIAGNLVVGIAVCSVIPRVLCTARFDNVQIADLLAGTEQLPD